MVIRKMNTVLVKHNKILFGAFSIIIIISFVWFFTPGMDGSMFFGNKTSPSSAVGKVFGKKVALKDYQRAIEAKSILLSLYTPASPSELREYAAANIFVDIAMDAAAEKAGVAVSDEDVIAEIKRIPFFSPDGKFDNKRYETFLKMNVEPAGLTTADFENFVRRNLAARKVLSDIAVNVVFVPEEFQQFQNFNMEKVKAATITFPFASYRPTGKITEQELLDFYKANSKSFMTAPQIKADIVAFDYKNYLKKVSVTERDVQEYYTHSQDQFKKDGKVLPLAQVKAKVLAAVKLKKAKELALDAAKAFRDELYDATSEISTGAGQIEIFRKLAAKKQLSILVSPWVTANAEKLGPVGAEPALIAALFRTSDRYPITRSVEGVQGAYVALAALRQPSVEAPFAEVKAQVQERLIRARSMSNAKEAASDFAAKLSASKNPIAELAVLSKNPAVKIKQLPVISRQTPSADPIARYALEMPGNVSSALELPDGMVVVLVEKRTLPTEAEKLAAKEQLTQDYLAEKRALASVAFQNWVLSNVESYLERDEQKAHTH